MLEAWITPQRIPKRIETDLAVGYACRDFGENLQLLHRQVGLAGPGTDHRIKIKDFRAVERVFRYREKLDGPARLLKGLFFSPQRSIDQT